MAGIDPGPGAAYKPTRTARGPEKAGHLSGERVWRELVDIERATEWTGEIDRRAAAGGHESREDMRSRYARRHQYRPRRVASPHAQGPRPLRERVTLFWHNHFATSNAKVLNAARMFGQYELMQRHALGNFADLLQEMSKDPAMMVWLDTIQSKKGQPNENYARELMELFSLGIGNYSEQDIREAAKAFTGWEIRNDKFYFNAAQYDDSPKTVMGKSGRLKGEDIVDICLSKPACPPKRRCHNA